MQNTSKLHQKITNSSSDSPANILYVPSEMKKKTFIIHLCASSNAMLQTENYCEAYHLKRINIINLFAFLDVTVEIESCL